MPDSRVSYPAISAKVLGDCGLLTLVVFGCHYLLAWPPQSLFLSLTVVGVIATLLVWLLPLDLFRHGFGKANRVTLLRTGLIALLAGLVGHPDMVLAQGWLISGVALFILMLDGVDGWLARRNGLQSQFGARFDMEADAFFILILSVLVFQSEKAGVWVLLSGALRYIFAAAGLALPWLQNPLPPRRRRQTLCVVQTAALIACLNPLVEVRLATPGAAFALVLLSVSFAIDTAWLICHAPKE